MHQILGKAVLFQISIHTSTLAELSIGQGKLPEMIGNAFAEYNHQTHDIAPLSKNREPTFPFSQTSEYDANYYFNWKPAQCKSK
ncbi:hypothetical protein O181_045250 [Austropuccinia psidii MF-1]|uniref:Uncharacterized protein n=1 Tax=Austropuccinia psidii MF-1 TaxID=1389203 RepID=A0A9Q3DR21_9BASI|nr:hypothetical protein [Austropuccinia psidii MF-1]